MSLLELDAYRVQNPEQFATPVLLHFEAKVEHNLRTLLDLVRPDQLCPHTKTHKSLLRTRQCLEAGIRRFKAATLRELEMLAQAGAPVAFLAYPLLGRPKIERFLNLQRAYPRTEFWALVGKPEHVPPLGGLASERGQRVCVLLDVDVGMHRTGIAPGEEAVELYRVLGRHPALRAVGVHVYDGHHHFTDRERRRAAAEEVWRQTLALVERLEAEGGEVEHLILGGSYSFPYYPEKDPRVAVSPGTWVYWDAGYGEGMPDMPFQPAAVVLGQVVDAHPEQGTVTLDVGSKAISADKETSRRFRLAGYPHARPLAQSEEHVVVATGGHDLHIGQYVLVIPGHVCTTTPKYPGAYRIDAEGRCIGWVEHTARDR
jgi:D-serine deaminase-like pyridoxal phosphate-dependent protein